VRNPRSIALTGLLLAAWPTAAQGPRAMRLVDLLGMPRLGSPQLSPDGRFVVFTREEADWKANRPVTHLHRVGLDGTGPVQLTYGEKGESEPRFSPDGKELAFLARRGESDEAQVYLLRDEGGEARALTRHATGVSSLRFSPDGRSVYFLAPEPRSAEEKERDKARDDVYAFDENYKQRHLWRVEVATGAEKRITDGDYTVAAYEPSRDGTKIALLRSPTPLFGDAERGEVWVMDADGGNAVRITSNGVGESSPELSPDNSRVLFLSDANARFETYYNGKVFVAPAAGGPARLLAPGFAHDVGSASWSKDGRSVFVVANTGVTSQLFELDAATGGERALTAGDHAVGGWTYEPDAGRHVFVLDEPTRGEVWTLAAASGSAPARVTRVFEAVEREFALPRQERVRWKGADGVAVEGLLYYPVDYQPGRRYPLCVQTHGGPASSDRFGLPGWGSYVPVLAGRGWAVLKPNYRGSTGYGDAFLRDMVGGYFRNAHLDVMAGVDHLVRIGLADPDRMVKMGWSAGAHMTNKIVTFTSRFKAASSGAGAGNWISMYAQSDVRSYRTPWFGGTPWQRGAPIDVYWEHSPLKHVAGVKTPTLFIVGEQDARVPPPQSVEMYRALKANGVPTHLYMAPREPHGWRELRHRLFKMNVELAWFEKHALGREYQWEKPPAAPSEEKREGGER
jgi:dipeptidyl aminopeptidase/acylaminoacyl peptidase